MFFPLNIQTFKDGKHNKDFNYNKIWKIERWALSDLADWKKWMPKAHTMEDWETIIFVHQNHWNVQEGTAPDTFGTGSEEEF